MIKFALGLIAVAGGFVGWITALDAPHMRSARFAGRAGFAIALLCIVALVALPGCQAAKTVIDAARSGDVR